MEQNRQSSILRDLKAKVDTEQSKLNAIIKKKKEFEGGKELDDKQDKPKLTKAEQTKLNNAVREARLELSEANTKLTNVSGRTKRFEEENKELKVQNDALNKTYAKAVEEKIKLSEELSTIKARLKRAIEENERKIETRLFMIEALAKEHEDNISQIEIERKELKVEISKYNSRSIGLAKEQETILKLQVDLNTKIDEAQKEKDESERLQFSLNRRILAQKNEDNRLEIIRLKLIKRINDNKMEKELKDLRKELLK